MYRRIATGLTAAAAAAVMVATLSPASSAAMSPSADNRASLAQSIPADMMAALQRDLGMSADQVLDRLVREATASARADQLRQQLGQGFGGAWLTDGNLTVAVTDPGLAARVEGATVQVVAFSERQLDDALATLNAAQAPASVSGWAVDVAANRVVIYADPGSRAEVAAFIRDSGVDPAMVRVETVTDRPVPLYDLIGGDAYYIGSARCSIGFSVLPRGFVTAGHCGRVGNTTRGYNGVSQGTFQRSVFPYNDAAYVAVNTSWTPRPYVRTSSGLLTVRGSTEAAVGATVCRSGSTTGWRCGTITAKNQTVNYPQGTVYGLTRTTACAEPGDSGGSFITPAGQAQGVTSGGSGNCSVGGVTYFQPLRPMLTSWGLTLVTG